MPEHADCRPVQGASASISMSFGSPLVGRSPYVGMLQEQARGRLNMGPTPKSFNINFASLYERIGEASSRPSNMWCGDEEAREVVERLNRDASFEPVYAGPLENASVQEQFIKFVFGIARGGMGQFLYRMAPPDRL